MDEEELEEEFDCKEQFESNEVFSTRADLIAWAQEVARNNGFVIVILKSDNGGDGGKRRAFVTLGCERSGSYKKYVRPFKLLVTGTKKCECPFMIRGRPHVNAGGGWVVLVINGRHNHRRADVLVGHPYPSRLKPNEKDMVHELTKNFVKPSNILAAIKDRDPTNLSTLKTIYNERERFRRQQRGSLTEMQYLMKLLESEGYTYYVRRDEQTDMLEDIFWVNPIALKLYVTFNLVVCIDTTYKTNKYKLPLFEIVGITSTTLTFSIACAFLQSERADNFTWALHKLKLIVSGQDLVPRVIVTDRDLALVNAVREVFPTSRHLLCQYHIDKNVIARIKENFIEQKEREIVKEAWQDLVDSPTTQEYDLRLQKFIQICDGSTKLLEYCFNTWLVDHKEKFVHAWIGDVMHLGTTTSNRVEGAHGKLKKLLRTSQGDLCRVWKNMHSLMVLQQNKIQAAFQASMIVIEHRYNVPFFSKLRGRVSRAALDYIDKELKKTKKLYFDGSYCDCVLRKNYGLPCACELHRWEQYYGFIPLEEVSKFWRTLWIYDEDKPNEESTERLCVVQNAMTNFWVHYETLDVSGQDALVYKLNELSFPETTSLRPPPEKTKTKGRPSKKERSTKRDPSYWEHVDSFEASNQLKKSSTPGVGQQGSLKKSRGSHPKVLPYIGSLPGEMIPFIDEVIDVLADGNCGYRVVSSQLGYGEHGWAQVRQELSKEMTQNRVLYRLMFGEQAYRQYLKSFLVDSVVGTQPMSKWMVMPDMGHAIATRYQMCVVLLTTGGSLTLLPLQARVRLQGMITIAFVNGNHFVQVKLKNNCPLPPMHPQWDYFATPEAKAYLFEFVDRITMYTNMNPTKEPICTPIDLDDD